MFSSLTLTFAPSTGFQILSAEFGIITDQIHEEDEGFIILARFEFTNDADRTAFENNIEQDIALVRIINDDGELYYFI